MCRVWSARICIVSSESALVKKTTRACHIWLTCWLCPGFAAIPKFLSLPALQKMCQEAGAGEYSVSILRVHISQSGLETSLASLQLMPSSASNAVLSFQGKAVDAMYRCRSSLEDDVRSSALTSSCNPCVIIALRALCSSTISLGLLKDFVVIEYIPGIARIIDSNFRRSLFAGIFVILANANPLLTASCDDASMHAKQHRVALGRKTNPSKDPQKEHSSIHSIVKRGITVNLCAKWTRSRPSRP